MLKDDFNNKRMSGIKAKPNQKLLQGVQGGGFLEKSPPGRRRQRKNLLILFFLFFIPGLIVAVGQYKVLSWKGDVRVKRGDVFKRLAEQSKMELAKGDILRIVDGAVVELLLPGGLKKEFYGPRLTTVEKLEKSNFKRESGLIVNLKKITGLDKILFRDKEDPAGATKSDNFKNAIDFFEKIKNSIQEEFAEVKDNPPAADKEKEMKEILSIVNNDFDAAPLEKQAIMKSRIYKHFNQDKRALQMALNYYEKILKVKGKQREREILEKALLEELLPIVVTFKVDEPDELLVKELKIMPKVSIVFSANFKLWWAAFYYDGKGVEEIDNMIDHSQHPRDTFNIKHDRNKEKGKSLDIFVIACSEWSELEKYDDGEVVKNEFLGREIEGAVSGKVRGFSRVFMRVDLGSIESAVKEK